MGLIVQMGATKFSGQSTKEDLCSHPTPGSIKKVATANFKRIGDALGFQI